MKYQHIVGEFRDGEIIEVPTKARYEKCHFINCEFVSSVTVDVGFHDCSFGVRSGECIRMAFGPHSYIKMTGCLGYQMEPTT